MIFAKEVGESLTYKFAQAAAAMRAHGREAWGNRISRHHNMSWTQPRRR